MPLLGSGHVDSALRAKRKRLTCPNMQAASAQQYIGKLHMQATTAPLQPVQICVHVYQSITANLAGLVTTPGNQDLL